MDNLFLTLQREIPTLRMERGVPLARLTTFRIGGPAALVVYPETEAELRGVLGLTRGTPRLLLGAGSNVLAPDAGFDGVVISTRGLRKVTVGADGTMTVQAGATMASAAQAAQKAGLQGMEFAHGIPGTVGGGLYMNAGAYGGEMSQLVRTTRILLPDGEAQTIEGEAHRFAYRSSVFQTMECVIVETTLTLAPGDPAQIRARMQELAEKRRASQPLEYPSAGSAFKRPATGYAAALIDQAGLKGLRVGGAAVSEKHAGFVVNLGGATAADVLALLREVRARVLAHSGVELEPEIRLWGEK